jgi:hypothetical protein
MGGDLQSMMDRGKAMRTKDTTIKNDNHLRYHLPPFNPKWEKKQPQAKLSL